MCMIGLLDSLPNRPRQKSDLLLLGILFEIGAPCSFEVSPTFCNLTTDSP